MKKGYKLCPHCGKEIKSKAIKCQYCFKFLEEEKKEKECPYCLNNIDINAKICPFCDEKLIDDEVIIDEGKKSQDNVEKKHINKKDVVDKNKSNLSLGIKILIGFIILIGVLIIGYLIKLQNGYNKIIYGERDNSIKSQKIITNFENGGDELTFDTKQFENNMKCQEYLDDFKSQFGTGYKEFSAFFSKNLNTCFVSYTYEGYEFLSPRNRNHDTMYFVQDLFNKSSVCSFGSRKKLYYPDSITNESNYSVESEVKICSCENLLGYNDEDIKLCNLGVGNIKELQGKQINYIK